MFTALTTPLFSLAAIFLIVVDPSQCGHLSRRATASKSAFSHHRFVRRSIVTLTPSSHQRRSMSEEDDDVFPRFGSLSLDDDDSTNFRRSLTDLDDPQDNSSSLEQEKADAEKDWEQFVASTPDEDLDSYPDSFAQDVDSNSSCSDEATDSTDASKTSSNLAASTPPPSQDAAEHKPNKSKHSGASKKKDPQAPNQLEDTAQQNEADAAQRKQAEVDKQKKVDADKEKNAQADKEKNAQTDEEKNAEADQEKKAEEDKERQAEADKERKAAEDKEAEAAKAKKEADQANAAKAAEEATKKQAAQPPQSQDNDQTKDVSSIPGTSVQTGTVHKDHKGDSYSAPSSEEHTGDATYYEPGMGACGLTNNSGDMIVAVSKLLYDSFPSERGNPNTNKVCGKRIRATYKGKSCDLTVVDRCEGCLHDDLDMTITAFEKLGSKEEGRLHGMTWNFI
ncbi:hypothetical protein MJO28_006083 [Puccinia striiformis f. sp. tritici]|uniref:RlpA-like protein double-psi beta-barrel domain-containing protein n=2 Tax=Puccinia striiformis f. sp. tritici TaxID=168172 RepID=A0A0L0V255_9BASI|nr:hypothetical protein Pst134EA_011312 [Puccinia striiformis f. sp. tritici]KNE93370.1 hypothetical protein PSTG_13311 [Puccinia striiformis f. sp. tritici PST-78]KAH9456071.1 hypothetical protein Pst134EB_012283 [Puccinia striiformis f. sp. tritici]KAH9467677.1 hypothetical protein Pst134EA_011312 [Puccinia striiformis f. sp. tritici]KAI7953536.1 hypothetical protein MJO28_006083 [Puccinia striiformis f. sp. tritici]KAI7957880.1 hypothetical protein MJO29_006097 [Puccinia striiformis f. sp. 